MPVFQRGGGGSVRRILRRTALVLALLLLTSPILLTLAYRFVPPPVITGMIASKLQGQTIRHEFVPLEQISRFMPAAVIMSEDNLFCSHWGVDWTAMQRQLAKLENGESPRGASTITMQTARALFLWQGRSYVRKALEVPLSSAIALILPRRRVMELYLNVAEWGPGIFGVEAASRRFFGKPAAYLTLHEAALLAATLPNPAYRRPNRPSRLHRRLAHRIVSRVRKSGGYTDCVQRRWAHNRHGGAVRN